MMVDDDYIEIKHDLYSYILYILLVSILHCTQLWWLVANDYIQYIAFAGWYII